MGWSSPSHHLGSYRPRDAPSGFHTDTLWIPAPHCRKGVHPTWDSWEGQGHRPARGGPVPGTAIAGPPGTPTPLASSAHAPPPSSSPGTHVPRCTPGTRRTLSRWRRRLVDGAEALQEPQGTGVGPQGWAQPRAAGFSEAPSTLGGGRPCGCRVLRGGGAGGPRGMRLTQARAAATQHGAGGCGEGTPTPTNTVSANPEAQVGCRGGGRGGQSPAPTAMPIATGPGTRGEAPGRLARAAPAAAPPGGAASGTEGLGWVPSGGGGAGQRPRPPMTYRRFIPSAPHPGRRCHSGPSESHG